MGRKTFFREMVQSFLIVCEGEETERLYFNGFRVPGDIKHLKVEGLGKNTVSLVREAIKLKKQKEYDQVWVVFDIEDYSAEQVNTAIHLAHENGIKVAYSNQAFELWYLLHFHYHHTAISRGEYMQRLSKLLGFQYEKNNPDLFMVLLKRQPNAVENARRLLALYERPNPCKDDPCTTVFQLVEELNQYTPDSRRTTR